MKKKLTKKKKEIKKKKITKVKTIKKTKGIKPTKIKKPIADWVNAEKRLKKIVGLSWGKQEEEKEKMKVTHSQPTKVGGQKYKMRNKTFQQNFNSKRPLL